VQKYCFFHYPQWIFSTFFHVFYILLIIRKKKIEKIRKWKDWIPLINMKRAEKHKKGG